MTKLFVGYTLEWFEKEKIQMEPEEWEDGSRVDNTPGRFEWWYFDAHFEDGSIVVASIFSKPYTNINLPCTPQVKLTITNPASETFLNIDAFKASDFIASTTTCDVKVGPNWIKGNLETYQLHFEVKGTGADLEFTRIAPSWRPGTGKCYFGEELKDYLGRVVPIPYGSVAGTLMYNGQVHEVNGGGYHEHIFGNIPLTEIIDHWYWGRLGFEDYNCIYFQFFATKKYDSEILPLFMFSKESQLLTGDGSKLKVIVSDPVRHSGGKTYPTHLKFVWDDGNNSMKIDLTHPTLLEATSLLKGFSPFKRMVARLFVNPYYFRWNADGEIQIDFDDLHNTTNLKVQYESMMLR